MNEELDKERNSTHPKKENLKAKFFKGKPTQYLAARKSKPQKKKKKSPKNLQKKNESTLQDQLKERHLQF